MKWRIVLIVIFLILTSGVANYKELNELAIVSSLGIEKSEDGNYKVSVQVMNSKKSDSGTESSGSQSNITVYTSEDKTVQAALRSIINESPKKLHPSHLKLLIISEEVAREGVHPALDLFIRNTDVNYDTILLIAKEGSAPLDIISTLTPIEMNPSANISDSLEETYKYEGTAIKKTLYSILDETIKDYHEALVSSVELVGKKEEGKKLDNIESSVPETKVVISDVAYFNGDKMVGYISKNDAKVYNMINNDLKNTIIQLNKESVNLAFEVLQSKCKKNLKINDGKISIKLSFDITANLVEASGKITIRDEKDLKEFENALARKITNMVNEYLNNLETKYMVDISGFGDMLYKKYYKDFIKISKNYLNNIDFSVETKVSLENEGSVLRND